MHGAEKSKTGRNNPKHHEADTINRHQQMVVVDVCNVLSRRTK
jgi:hypothetical protein